jgi:hypothetical protein
MLLSMDIDSRVDRSRGEGSKRTLGRFQAPVKLVRLTLEKSMADGVQTVDFGFHFKSIRRVALSVRPSREAFCSS